MNKTTKIVGIIVLLAVLVGGYFYPKYYQNVQVQGVSTAGATYGTSKTALAVLTLSTTAGSSTAILNDSAVDRYVTRSYAACQGLGTSFGWPNAAASFLDSLRVFMATSSTANQAGATTTSNWVANLTISTSSPTGVAYVGSSTEPFPNVVTHIWPTNTYLVMTSNATNTGTCTLGVDYIGS